MPPDNEVSASMHVGIKAPLPLNREQRRALKYGNRNGTTTYKKKRLNIVLKPAKGS